MAPPKIPQIRHAEDVDPSEKDAMHLEGVKYFLEHPPEDTQVGFTTILLTPILLLLAWLHASNR